MSIAHVAESRDRARRWWDRRGSPRSGSPGSATIGSIGGEVDLVDAAVVVGAGVGGRRRARAARLASAPGPLRGDPANRLLVGLDRCPCARSTRSPCWRAWRARPSTGAARPGPAELHDAVERLLRPRVVEQDVEHHVLGGDARAERPRELEADRLGDPTRVKPAVDQRRVLGRADTPGQGVVPAAHAGVAVGRLDEVAGLDELLARDLVADARARRRRAALKSRTPVCALELALQVAQGLDLRARTAPSARTPSA